MKTIHFLLLVVSCTFATSAEDYVPQKDKLLNYETEEISEVYYDDVPDTPVDIQRDENGATITIDPTCAFIYSSGSLSAWRVKPFPFTFSTEVPAPDACFVDYTNGENYTITPETKVTVLEAEYKDFPGYEFGHSFFEGTGPGGSGAPALVYKPLTETYIGFRPNIGNIGWAGDSKDIDYWVEIALTQYDCEHKVVRAYTHLKVRIDYAPEATITETVAPATPAAATFDLQGRRIANPSHPGIYIINGTKTHIR